MSDSTSTFDASQSALGYLHQCRYALLLALQRDDEPNLCISIEKLDDIAFHDNPSSPAHAKELLQVKHHINRAGGLGDSSLDIWKTLRIWSEVVTKNHIDLDRITLCLVTTSTPTNRNAIRLLTPDPQSRKPQEGRAKLEQAGATSRNDTVKEAFGVYMGLPDPKRAKLFDSIYLLDNSLTATDLQRAIGNAVRHAVEPKHRQAFVERLEGWWFHRVVVHLIATSNQPIPVVAIQQQVHELRGQFQRECLPDDLFSASVPADATPDTDDRVFVLQLVLIGLPPARSEPLPMGGNGRPLAECLVGPASVSGAIHDQGFIPHARRHSAGRLASRLQPTPCPANGQRAGGSKMNPSWNERPTELANLLNPAFTGAALRMAVSGYVREAQAGMPFELAFLVFPFCLHRATRDRLPRAVSTLLHTWLQENKEVLVQFSERSRSLLPFTKEAIVFACQRGVLMIDDAGLLQQGDATLKGITSYKTTSDEVKEATSLAEFVGRWFALSGTPVTIYTLLGVRP